MLKFFAMVPVAFLFWAAGCASNDAVMNSRRGTIFEAEQTGRLASRLPLLSLGAPYWTPSGSDVEALERKFPSYLDRFPKLGVDREQYNAQYFGITESGQRVIFASYYCKSLKDLDPRKPVIRLDGGKCYFSIRYHVGSGEFRDLRVNPEA